MNVQSQTSGLLTCVGVVFGKSETFSGPLRELTKFEFGLIDWVVFLEAIGDVCELIPVVRA